MLSYLWLIAASFLVLWILGIAFRVTLGGLVHLLLVAALVAVLVSVFKRRRVA
jgi:hypothetical protein